MKFEIVCFMATFVVSTPGAFAQASDPVWTFSTSGSWAQTDTSDRDNVTGSISLSRLVGEGRVGLDLATSDGSDALFDQAEIVDRSSLFASAWLMFPAGPVDLDLGFTLGREDFEGRVPLERADAEVNLNSEVDIYAVSAAISKVLVQGYWDIIPNASLGWSQSEAASTAEIVEALADLAVLSETQEGATASLGLGLGYVAHDQLYLFSDLSGYYAENGASVSVGQASRTGGLRASSRQTPDEANWAEVSLGASVYATDTLTLSLSGGSTLGRDEEEVFASTSLSVSF